MEKATRVALRLMPSLKRAMEGIQCTPATVWAHSRKRSAPEECADCLYLVLDGTREHPGLSDAASKWEDKQQGVLSKEHAFELNDNEFAALQASSAMLL